MNGFTWFATDKGLLLQEETTGELSFIDEVTQPLIAVQPISNGQSVWFSISQSNNIVAVQDYEARLGLYDMQNEGSNAHVEFFTPVDKRGNPLAEEVLSITTAPDQSIVFGDISHEVFQYNSTNGWIPFARSRNLILKRAEILAYVGDVLWGSDGINLFRYKENTWQQITYEMLPDANVSAPTDIVSDGNGKLWVGHQKGITVFRGDTSGNLDGFNPFWCSLPAEISGQVFDLALSNNKQVLWVSTENGIGRLLIPDPLPEDCGTWNWMIGPETPELSDFFDLSNPVHIEVDTNETSDKVILWVFKQFTDRVYTLTYSQ